MPGRARQASPPRPLAGNRPSLGRAEWGPPGSPPTATLRTCSSRRACHKAASAAFTNLCDSAAGRGFSACLLYTSPSPRDSTSS
eukprot:3121626-Prorocentrum_lima.AAC.1